MATPAGTLRDRLIVEPISKRTIEFETETFTLDRLYMSMTGPSTRHPNLKLLPNEPQQVVWLTGIEATVVDGENHAPISPEFFCHANLTFDPKLTSPARHNMAFANQTNMDWRFFTLVPGRMSLHLPPGFGMPLYSDTPLDFFSMSLNQNVTDKTVRVRFENRIEFVRNADLTSPMRAVFRRALYVLEPIASSGIEKLGKHSEASHPGEGCADPNMEHSLSSPLPETATSSIGRTATKAGILEEFGDDVTIHWLVPPGVHSYTTPVSKQLKLSQPTSLHYATGHLHPFATAIELYDRTIMKTVVRLKARDFSDRLGVEQMEELSSTEGILLYPDHEYELRADYNNRTPKETDAMAILYLYFAEPQFVPPA